MFIHINRSNKTNNRHLEIATNQSAGRSDFLPTHCTTDFGSQILFYNWSRKPDSNDNKCRTTKHTYSSKVLLLVSVIRG